MSKYRCAMPFKSLVMDYAGISGPCPNNGYAYGKNEVGLEKNWFNSKIKDLQAAHLNDQRAPACERCYVEEQAGMRSTRHFANTWYYAGYEDSLQSEKYKEGPEQLVIRLSNICNFACRTCNARNSSLYIREGQYYKEKYQLEKSDYDQIRPIQEVTEIEFDQMFELCSQLKKLQFFGGEPLINKTHYYLLEKLVQSGQAQDIELFYCTNGSKVPDEKLRTLWKSFKKIILNFSVDAIEKEFEYIRWPGKWPTLVDHIQKFKKMRDEEGFPIEFSSTLTISTLNLWSLPQIDSWLQNELGRGDYLTLAHQPTYYCIQNIPEELKQIVSKRFEELGVTKKYEFVLNFMFAEKMKLDCWQKFRFWTNSKDEYRNNSFSESFPQYSSLIKKLSLDVRSLKSPECFPQETDH